jgi:uncharacterized RDD family membrane protein YckC
MKCPSCDREIVPDAFFCAWCNRFLPAPGKGVKAGLFVRWVALLIDPLIGIVLYFAALAVFASISQDVGVIVALAFPVAYGVWFITLLRRGLTPGKRLLGLQVVRQESGEVPGFGTMFVREVVGRLLSALFLGLGYFWALADRNAQAWHDKLARTVVLKVG